MSSKYQPFLILAIITLLSCHSTNQTTQKIAPDHHTAQNALDWQGTYLGVLPCASCPGIETELILNSNQTFVLKETYLEKENIFTRKGKFIWQNNTIQLEDSANMGTKTMFKVEEGRLRKLDTQGNQIEGALAANYILTKNGNDAIENIKWVLIEINSKTIHGKPDTHYLIFHSKEGALEAKANCNRIRYNYKIRNQKDLSISMGMSTLMACPDTTEKELTRALGISNTINIDSDTLSIYDKEKRALIKCVKSE